MALPLLFLASSGANIASQIQQGRIADHEARAEARWDERNAAIAELDAKARERKAQFDSVRQSVAAGEIIGGLTARLGASGARLDVGAPIRLLTEQSEELELDNMLIGFEGQVDAARLRGRADIFRTKAKFARARGKSARKVSLLRAFGTATSAAAMGAKEGFFGSGSKGGGGPGVIEARDTGS